MARNLERLALAQAMRLPPRLQRVLAGRPVVLDGQTLAVDVQLQLRMKQLVHPRASETMPVAEGRRVVARDTYLVGGDLPIGGVRDLEVAGRPARLYVPRGAPDPGPLLVFLHGGGFMHGDLETHDAPCRFLAEQAGVRVLAVDYRLGPEHRFPAAYDDAVAAYAWTVEHAAELGGDPQRLGVGGDSAGGTLSAGVAIEAARRGWPCRVQLLVYPATDARRATPSARLFADGFYLSTAYMDLANASYAGTDADLDDPRYSPAYADLPDGLAPALVFTAGFDPLRDEGEAYAQKLRAAGARVELTRFRDQIHGFFNIVGVAGSSREANRAVARSLRAVLA